jgi:hypothetical protein
MVSDQAKACPSCGISKPIKKKTKWLWITLALIIFFIAIAPKNHRVTEPAAKEDSSTDSTAKAEQLERAKKQLESAMQDPRKVRLMECVGVNPWKVKPDGWTPPTKEECDQLKRVLGSEADAREKSYQSNLR